MSGRKIKSGDAEVRRENDQVVVKGDLVTEEGDPIGGGPAITVGTTQPSDPASGGLWIDTDN